MSRLADIGIRVEPGIVGAPAVAAAGFGLGGGLAAILSELVTLLERLADAETPAAIDLRSLPMSPQDRVELRHVIGEGEVRATVDAQGLSTLCETRIAGVWWIEHRDPNGELVAELLEVTRLPAFLASAPDDIAAGAQALRRHISEITAVRTSLGSRE